MVDHGNQFSFNDPIHKKIHDPNLSNEVTFIPWAEGIKGRYSYFGTTGEHNKPITRPQLIGRYRQEMIELVRDLPESAYELSLKDIVELPKARRAAINEKDAKKGVRKVPRRENIDAGVFLLKMFLPSPLRGKRTKSGVSRASSSKVSPKPLTLCYGEDDEIERRGDGVVWKKDEHGERRSSRKLAGCFSVFQSHKSKEGETRDVSD